MTGDPATITGACASAGQFLAAIRAAREQRYLDGGPEAVARAACPSGTPQQQQAVAATYGRLREQATAGSAA